MATEAQVAANARNCRKSTGPKTREGKARASKNAMKHGLRSEDPVLQTLEDESEWLVHLQTYIEDAQPVGDVEFKLAEKAAMCLWKQARVELMMAYAQDRQITQSSSPPIVEEAVPAAERDQLRDNWLGIDLSTTSLDSLQRYYNAFEAGFFRAYRELEKRRIERKKDAQREQNLDILRWKASLTAPKTPTLAMIVSDFESKYDDDLEFLLIEELLNPLEREAALQVQTDRLREQRLAEYRARITAEASAPAAKLALNGQSAVAAPAAGLLPPHSLAAKLASFGQETQMSSFAETYGELNGLGWDPLRPNSTPEAVSRRGDALSSPSVPALAGFASEAGG